MRILVSAKRSLDPESRLVADGPRLASVPPEFMLDPHCEAAIEAAVRLAAATPGAEVVAFSVGGPECQEQLRKALAMGAGRAVRVEYTGAPEPCALAAAIAGLARAEAAELLLLGRTSSDGDSMLVAPLVAAMLGWPLASSAIHPGGEEGLKSRSPALALSDGRLTCRMLGPEGALDATFSLPLVVSADLRLALPSLPTVSSLLSAAKKPIQVMALAPPAARSEVLAAGPVSTSRKPAVEISLDELAELLAAKISARKGLAPEVPEPAAPADAPLARDPAAVAASNLLVLPASCAGKEAGACVAFAQELQARGLGGFDLLLLDPAASLPLVRKGAGRLLHFDRIVPLRGDVKALAPLADAILAAGCYERIFLPHGTWASSLLAVLALRLAGASLSRVVAISEAGILRRTCCCGKAFQDVKIAEGACAFSIAPSRQVGRELAAPSPVQVLPAPTDNEPLSLADSGGLENADVLLVLGRGVKEAGVLAEALELARLLGAVVGGTKVAVEEGLVQPAGQVGQSGRTCYPDLYLGLGVSGAVQHLSGIRNAGQVVVINKDAAAPFAARADFLVSADLRQALPALLAKLRSLGQNPAWHNGTEAQRG